MMSYLDTRVGVYLYGKSKKTGRPYYQIRHRESKTLREVLQCQDYRHLITAYRKCKKPEVKQKIASFTPSGFYDKVRDKNTQPDPSTGLIQIDIDGKTNTAVTDWPNYRDYLFNEYKFIAVCALSCGGNGLYILINTTGWQHYERHYYAAVELFTEREGLEIDHSVSSTNEIRYLSLPEDVLMRDNAEVFKTLRDKPKSAFDGVALQGDGELIQCPVDVKMRRREIVDLITRNLHNGTAIDKVKAYLTLCKQIDPTSHLYGDVEEMCRLADDLYRRYADQFNQVLQVGQRARISSGRTKTMIHPATQERDKRLEDHEKLSIASDYVRSRVVYDVIGDRYILDDQSETSPANEYEEYNSLSDTLTYIEKHFFVNAFETGKIPRVNLIHQWADALPKWDGVDWIHKLSQFIPAEDKKQAELFFKAWLTRSYIQAVNPENLNPISIVNRWLLILHQHREESGKSSFLQWISPSIDWVKLSGLEENKDGFSAMAKYMFVLDEELAGLGSFKFHTKFKAMMSTAKIDVRPPYAKADIKMNRIASFYGSTNNDKIFPATEGNSRFLVIKLTDDRFDWQTYTREIDKEQMWSQVKHLAATSYLSEVSEDISTTQREINADLVRDSTEMYTITEYLEADLSGNIMQTEKILETFKMMGSTFSNLNLTTLGQALRKVFGPRVNGYTSGVRRKGYAVKFKELGLTQGGSKPLTQVQKSSHAGGPATSGEEGFRPKTGKSGFKWRPESLK